MIDDAIRRLFAAAGCAGSLSVLDVDGDAQVHVGGDEPVIAASVLKVPVALEVFRQSCAGELDLRERVRIGPEGRTAGPTGFSLFADEVEVSLGDLVTMMLTISDNAATDVLIDRVGLGRIAATLDGLDLKGTAIPHPLRGLLDGIGEDAGHPGWAELTRAAATATPEQTRVLEERVRSSRALLRPEETLRTTARDMALLLRLVWRDEAGPARACAELREVMARQLTRHRLAMGFPPEVGVAAKSGSLFGVVRNEVGVLSLPGGRRYAAAVFTRADRPRDRENEINAAIGAAAALAVEHCQTGGA
ncbi:serine hydrolase [Nonomuraea sp. NN258]|uniref:serine hydrolase n=1 Tax=Nonomuraea antri TaxID=2730852 RepID=UPI001568DD19|nr:serine hydrolase [Nonomuraea antri]NRQ36201.1 serine hydrolase [Nonomuraea antri]